MFSFVKYRKIYFIFSGLLVLASLTFLVFFRLNPGIDFTGGSILELEYDSASPSVPSIRDQLKDIDLGQIYIQPSGEKGVLLRMKNIDEETHQKILQALREPLKTPEPVAEFIELERGEEGAAEILEDQNRAALKEVRFESIGPLIGLELKQKTEWTIGLSLALIVLYIAWAFRRVSRPCKSWQYGIAAIIALGHDVLLPVGVFSFLGRFYGVQVTVPIITALLTVLGYSVNDTVVVFDRVRENLLRGAGADFEQTVDKSLNQTLARSLGTSLTTLFVLSAIFFLGGTTLKYFSLALIIGIVAGTYSSIFLAGPLLFSWLKWRKAL